MHLWTHTVVIILCVYAHCQVVELHLEELWGYTIKEEPTDCEPEPEPEPAASHRYNITCKPLCIQYSSLQ